MQDEVEISFTTRNMAQGETMVLMEARRLPGGSQGANVISTWNHRCEGVYR